MQKPHMKPYPLDSSKQSDEAEGVKGAGEKATAGGKAAAGGNPTGGNTADKKRIRWTGGLAQFSKTIRRETSRRRKTAAEGKAAVGGKPTRGNTQDKRRMR